MVFPVTRGHLQSYFLVLKYEVYYKNTNDFSDLLSLNSGYASDFADCFLQLIFQD